MRLQRTARGARLMHGRHVISTLPGAPGPTHSLFDALAAALPDPVEGGPIAMLGFAAGGTMAPIRALGVTTAVRAVDLDVTAVPTFRSIADAWCGEVSVDKADALQWLQSQRERFAVIIEDLSMTLPGDITKPSVSYGSLPDAMAARLALGGCVLVNLLPVPGLSWASLEGRVCAPFVHRRRITLRDYDNRILMLSQQPLPDARIMGRRIQSRLKGLGSRLSGTASVRTLI